MKTYNKKLLEATKKLSNKTYQKAINDAQKATHPSPKVLKIGAMISSVIGLSLLIAGVVGLFIGKETLAMGILITGIIIIFTNYINMTRK